MCRKDLYLLARTIELVSDRLGMCYGRGEDITMEMIRDRLSPDVLDNIKELCVSVEEILENRS